MQDATSQPAQRMGLYDRGLLRPGMVADVVVFDPAIVRDVATYEDPRRYAEGIEYVIINGKLSPEFELTPANTLGVLGRTFSAAVKTGMRIQLSNIFTAARRDSIDVKFAAIPETFDHPSHGIFDPDYVKALFDLAFQRGQDGVAFSDKPASRVSMQPSQ